MEISGGREKYTKKSIASPKIYSILENPKINWETLGLEGGKNASFGKD
ncbi:MAG: hypothetical protein AAF591_10840 [Verrucomicrobiota bacterium]